MTRADAVVVELVAQMMELQTPARLALVVELSRRLRAMEADLRAAESVERDVEDEQEQMP